MKRGMEPFLVLNRTISSKSVQVYSDRLIKINVFRDFTYQCLDGQL